MNTIPARENSIIRSGVFAETIADGITGDALKISEKMAVAVLLAGSNNGKIQYTTSTDALIKAGTANWTDWEEGSVTGTNSTVFSGPVTALRCVSVSGEVSWEVSV